MQVEHQYYISAFNIIKYYLVLKQLYTHTSARTRTHPHDVSEVACLREQGEGTYSVSPVDKAIPYHLALSNGHPILLQRQPHSGIYIFI
jgi:hypothetical protein